MFLRTLPGLAIALVAGIAFCLSGKDVQRDLSEARTGKWSVEVARVDGLGESRGTPFFATNRVKSTPAPVVAPAAVPEYASQPARAATPVLFPFSEQPAPVAEVASATVHRAFSGLALASCAEPLPCAPETSAWRSPVEYPELPARGVELWAGGNSYSARQNHIVSGVNAYKNSGAVYSLGLRQDLSIYSTAGVSLDILDAKVDSRYDDDGRKNDIVGYFANAHYRNVFLDKFPVEVKGTYGRIYHKGGGIFRDKNTGTNYNWQEGNHRSHYYGLSAKAGLPLIFGGIIKVLPEAGLEYRKLKTKEFAVSLGETAADTLFMEKVESKSLAAPVSVTVKRDFEQCWGLATPRAKVGYTREFDASAGGLRALNSSTASRYRRDEIPNNKVRFDNSPRELWEFGVGLDVQTNGGWNMSADYNRKWTESYVRNEFTLELGKCF